MTDPTLTNLINHFNNENLTLFMQSKCRDFAPTKGDFDHIIEEGFEKIHKVGEIQFPNRDQLLVCSVKVTKNLTERSGKKAQFDLAKKVLKSYGDLYDGIFVFHDSEGNFRFSLIYANYFGTRKEFSNYRRFTYFVSKDQTNNTFKARMIKGDFSSMDGIKEAFSVEKVTKEFYEEISNWYFWACQLSKFPLAAEREENGRQVAIIRLITRLIFVWFMREKGLLPSDLFNKKVISECLSDLDNDSSSYYLAILQNLFFATLNTPQQERKFRTETRGPSGHNPDYGNQYVYRHQAMFSKPDQLKEYFKDIPFLNGGLFECLDNKETSDYFDGFTDIIKNQPIVPNLLFFSPETTADLNAELGTSNKQYKVKGLLETLSAYNFTIDENTADDKDVALDPELLGQVFENLLASFNPETSTTARKATGSYYTPREIVDYMVDESLKAYLRQYLGDIPDIEQKLTWLLSHDLDSNPFTEKERGHVVKLVEEVRIVDPAVGSGAFPMGALNKLVLILSKLDPDGNIWEQAQLDAAQLIPDAQIRADVSDQIRKSFLEKNHDYGRKLYLIQKCIYGVDIQQISVEIAKLRFFISLLVDETVEKDKDNWGIEPLPNLDFKIMQGNSLISTFEGIDLGPGLGIAAEQEDLFSSIGKKAELITNLRNLKDQYQTVSNHRRKLELQEEIDQYFLEIFKISVLEQRKDYATRLAAIDRKYQDVPDMKTREKLKAIEKEKVSKEMGIDINATGLGLNSYSTKLMKRDFFPWGIYFAEVFEEKGGFDIVIANPPYIRVQNLKSTEVDFFKSFYKTAKKKFDIYVIFYEKAFDLINKKGTITYISSNSFLRQDFGVNLRMLFQDSKMKIKIYDFDDNQVFQDVSTYTCIFTATKSNNPSINYIRADKNSSLDMFNKDKHFINNYRETKNLDWNLLLLDPVSQKFFTDTTPLSSFAYTRSPLFTGLDKYLLGSFNEEYQEETIWKKIARAQDIKRYFISDPIEKVFFPYNVIDSRFVLMDENVFQSKFPKTYLHLKQRDQELLQRKDSRRTFKQIGRAWYALMRTGTPSDYFSEKILTPAVVNKSSFAIDTKQYLFSTGSTYGIILRNKSNLQLKYIYAILNSKLGLYYFFMNSTPKRGGYVAISAKDLQNFPLKVISIEEQGILINLVNQVKHLTQVFNSEKTISTQEQIAKYDQKIDNLIYEIYGLSTYEKKQIQDKLNSYA